MDNSENKFQFYSCYFDKSLRNMLKMATGKDTIPKQVSDKKVMSPSEGNTYLYHLFENNNPFMVGRFGSTEIHAVNSYLKKKFGLLKKYKEITKTGMNTNSGFFPTDDASVDKFSEMMIDYSRQCDLLALLGNNDEYYIAKTYMKNTQLCRLRGIEPYYHNDPWSRALKDKTVLIIHPFEDTIRKQFEKREVLFSDPNVMPQFELCTLKAVQSVADEKCNFSNWFDALDYMTEEALKINFDIAIIGCGAYGFPLAARLKMNGKTAIHLGGAVQYLFGIRSSRGEVHPIISKLFNDNWVWPSIEETPKNYKKVENGCYWR